MARRAPGGSPGRRPFRRRLKDWRRAVVYFVLLAPVLHALERGPGWLVDLLLHRVVEPIAYLATRGQSLANLRAVFGGERDEAELRRIARAVTRNFVTGIGELSRALRRGAAPMFARVTASGDTNWLDDHEARYPQGFVGVTGHIGNWELLGAWSAARGTLGAGGVIAKRLTNPWLNARVERIRARLGMMTFYQDEPSSRLVRHLRSGRSLAIVPDQDIKNLGGVFVEFLGRPAYTPTGPARIALAANAPIVCGFLLRRPDGRFELKTSAPIQPDPRAPRPAEIVRLTQAWCAEVERVIRADPEQWAWFHPRWQTTPEKLAARGRGPLAADDDATAAAAD